MRLRWWFLVVVGWSSFACGGFLSDGENPKPSAASGATKGTKGKASRLSSAGNVVAQAREACTPDCRLLTEFSWETVQGNYCTLCGQWDETACEFDWPTNDVPQCELYDWYRNCIYATYGRTFTNAKWDEAFRATDWYQPDPAYHDDRLSSVARENIDRMLVFKKEKRSCIE